MVLSKSKKKPPMTLNLNSHPATFRYEVDPIAHLQYQTMYTKTGVLNMINRKPKSLKKSKQTSKVGVVRPA
jgi:hypothetical protein